MLKTECLRPGGPRFRYDTELFAPCTDSFLLAAFAKPGRGAAVCDLGCGAGLLGVLLLARDASLRLTNIESDERALALARQNFRENGWDADFRPGDLRDPAVLPGAGSIDYAVCNPPYFKTGSGKAPPDAARRRAREESGCTLDELCASAARILRTGGRFALVYRPERLTDLLCALRGRGIEPKRLRFFTPVPGAAPALVLCEARRGGKSGLTVEPDFPASGPEWEAAYLRG